MGSWGGTEGLSVLRHTRSTLFWSCLRDYGQLGRYRRTECFETYMMARPHKNAKASSF